MDVVADSTILLESDHAPNPYQQLGGEAVVHARVDSFDVNADELRTRLEASLWKTDELHAQSPGA